MSLHQDEGHVHSFSSPVTFDVTPPGRVAPWRISARVCKCGAYKDIKSKGLGRLRKLECIQDGEVLTIQEIAQRLDCEAKAVTAEVEARKAGGSPQVNHRHGGSDGWLGPILPGRR